MAHQRVGAQTALPRRFGEGVHVVHEPLRGVVLHPHRPLGVAVAPLVGRHNVVTGFGEGEHDLAPTVGEFRKTMQQKNERLLWQTRLKNMDAQTVHIVQKPGADSLGQHFGG